jgi:hypothetical protein
LALKVQRVVEKVLKIDGPFDTPVGVRVQRVQKVQRVQRVERVWYHRWSCFAAMSFIILLRRMENQTTGLRPMEMHPFWCCAPLPPEGEVFQSV